MMAFNSYEELQNRLALGSPTESEISEMQYLLAGAFEMMKSYTGRDLIYGLYTDYFFNINSQWLFPKNIPIDNDGLIIMQDGIQLMSPYYIVYTDRIYCEERFVADELKLQYYAGYKEGVKGYEELKMIEREIASIMWKRGGEEHFTPDQIGLANFEMMTLNAELKSLLNQLDKYRRYNI